MEADSPETLVRLSHPSPLIFNDWLIQESRSPDLLLQAGTTLLCELYSRPALNQNKPWCHLRSHCCLVLPFPLLPFPHSLGDIFLQSIPSIHHVHPNPFSVSDSKEPELRQILTDNQMKRTKIFTWNNPSQCLACKCPISANDDTWHSLAMVNSLSDITSNSIYIVLCQKKYFPLVKRCFPIYVLFLCPISLL